MAIRKDILSRFIIIYVFIGLFAIAVIARIIFLQFVEGDKWKKLSLNLSQKDIIIQANRGDIYDSEGHTLASSVPFYDIRMDMEADELTDEVFDENIDSLAICLANTFKDRTKDQFKKELVRARKNEERYHLIKKKTSYTEMKLLKTFPIFKLGKNRGGFLAIPSYKRVNPSNSLALRTIGQTNENLETGEKVGYSGLEKAFNHILKGEKGLCLLQKGSGNLWILDGAEPKDGKDIVTTIDINIQDVAETALRKQLEICRADWGTVVLMEVKTGEIKAIANLQRDSFGNYGEYFNFAVGASVEPGSIFKLPSLVVAMEDGYITPSDTFDVEGGVKLYYGREMKDSHKGGGRMSVEQIFEHSSNVGVSKIINRFYEKQPWKYIERLYSMKLNSLMGLDIPGEANSVILNPKSKFWSGLSLPWMSVGYSVQITPLQLLNFYNAIANNGKMVKPRFVKAIREHGHVIKTFDVEVINPSICSQQTVKWAKKMMEGVVERGTGHNLKNDHISIGGKTGTAQIARDNSGYGGDTKSYRASFIGYYPTENPSYSCIVMINNPRDGTYYGASLSGPVFKEIAELVYAKSLDFHEACKAKEFLTYAETPEIKTGYRAYLETACKELKLKYKTDDSDNDWVISKYNNLRIKSESARINAADSIVPNVVGMGLTDALFLLENKGLKVFITGRGVVRYQSLEPGLKANKNNIVKIELS